MVAENRLLINSMFKNFDPFKTLQLKHKFEINNLDEIYFNLYKNSQNKDEINEAYYFLKDEINKIHFLCFFNGFIEDDKNLPKEIFQIIESKIDVSKLFNETKEQMFNFAKNDDFEKAWYLFQKYRYLFKLTQKN